MYNLRLHNALVIQHDFIACLHSLHWEECCYLTAPRDGNVAPSLDMLDVPGGKKGKKEDRKPSQKAGVYFLFFTLYVALM